MALLCATSYAAVAPSLTQAMDADHERQMRLADPQALREDIATIGATVREDREVMEEIGRRVEQAEVDMRDWWAGQDESSADDIE